MKYHKEIEYKSIEVKELIKILKGEDKAYHSRWKGRDVVLIENSIFSDDIKLTDDFITDYKIVFRNVKFDGRFIINGAKFNDDLYISNDVEGRFISIWDGVFNKNLFFNTDKINSIIISGGSFEEISVASNAYLQILPMKILSGDTNGIIKIKKLNLDIHDLEFNNNIVIDGGNGLEFSIERLEIYNLGKSTIINHLKINEIIFNRFYLKGRLLFSDITGFGNQKSKMEFSLLDLGNTNFINCKFENFDIIARSSKIEESFFIGTSLPDVKTLNKSVNDISQRQLLLSQLKKSFLNRGDNLEASKFRAGELYAYFEKLSWSKNGWDKFNLYLNKTSTNFGQSWKKGLISTLIVALGFYLVYCYFIEIKLDGNIELYTDVAALFLEFVNPLHNPEYIPSKLGIESHNIPMIALAWENLSRIFIGYFIYQLIQAFRKYGKM